jgi:hypothetical protein
VKGTILMIVIIVLLLGGGYYAKGCYGWGWAEFNRAKTHSDERWGVPGVFYLASRGREMAGSDGLSLAYRLPQLSDTEARGWRCHSQRWILTEVMADKLL